MSAADRRGELEDAIAKALDVAWRSAVAHCAARLAAPGVPLGYPDRPDVTAALLASADQYATSSVDQAVSHYRLQLATAEYTGRAG